MQANRRTRGVPRTRFALLTGALLASALAACTQRPEPPRMEEPPLPRVDTTPEIPAETAGPTSRPETLQDTLVLEGMPEPVTLRLYRSPPGFPLPFGTYLPADLVAEPASSGGRDAVHFYANFGGQRNDAARVEMAVYPEGTTEEGARSALASATGGSLVAEGERRYPWALAEYAAPTGQVVSRGMLGRHDGRFFHVLVRYPAEFGDGFGPRAAMVLKHWQWEDGSGGLGS